MIDKAKTGGASGSRMWRKGERAKVSIMQVFRSAYQEHDARKANPGSKSGEVEISRRAQQRREGASEDQLRAHLETDLNALLNTIQLEAAVSLEDAPHVRRSIANYGFQDLSGLSLRDIKERQMIETIRQSLLTYEPRLTPHSIDVQVTEIENNKRQRLAIKVSADLSGDPVDIPLDFDAEVDASAGKLRMSKLRMQM
jgi:type VI secretion system protein ImpF